MGLEYRYSQKRGALHEAAQDVTQAIWDLQAIPPEILRLVPASVAHAQEVQPVALDGESLTLASHRPHDIAFVDRLTFLLNRKIVLVSVPRSKLLAAIRRHYGSKRYKVSAEPDTVVDQTASFGIPQSPSSASIFHRSKPKKTASMDLDSMLEDYEEKRLGPGQDTTHPLGESGMFFHVVEEGQRVLVRYLNGSLEIVAGPKRVWSWGRAFQPVRHFIAHPGEFLIIRYRDGRQEHLVGPTEIWFDPRIHQEIKSEEALQLSAKEAVVVYSKKPGAEAITRRIVYGPAQFVPQPGEWLHTFTWHAAQSGHTGAVKIPKGLVFQKIWLMPDQMYHDVAEVRTTDDAVVTIRLMIFFELIDIERMLDTTHDPIGDFVNAATSDVVAFVGKYDFETVKRYVPQLNELDTYRQLASRAQQSGYRINKIVYRGYDAPVALQKMQDEAIEARTKLQLQRATEQQAQDLENYKLDCQITRALKRRQEQSAEVEHDLEMIRRRQHAELAQHEAAQVSSREQQRLEAEQQLAMRHKQDSQVREHLTALRELGVGLTEYLTQARADRVIELRGASVGTHVHLDPDKNHQEGK
jgi:hypothetical protein